MAVLDEQSDAQSAVVLHYGIRKSTWDEIHEEVPDQEIPGNGMLREDGRIWWKFRIPFKHSYSFFTGLEHCDLEILELFCRPEHVGADGVVDTETCDKIIRG